VIIEAFFGDQEHLLDFIAEKLGKLPGVRQVETSLILKVAKFSYEWEIP
jgi:Lrp/AsnC family transcriptional regulator for asnA, asnC and gidA